MLQEVGITCSIEVMEFGSFISRTTAGEHDMGYTSDGWLPQPTRTTPTIHWTLLTAGRGRKPYLIADPEVDKLIETGRTSADESVRLKAYEELAVKLKEINNNAPITTAPLPQAQTPGEGFVMDPIGYHKLDRVKVAK